MSREKLPKQVIGLTLVIVVLVGCVVPAATPVSEAPAATSTSAPSTASSTPVPPTTTPTPVQPTAIPTPNPSPTPIPGIEEPVVVRDMNIRVLEAYTEDSLSSGESTEYPDDPSHTFFVVVAEIERGGDARNRLSSIIWLVHEGEEYEMVNWGIKVGEDGKFVGTMLVFSVPKVSEFAEYSLQLTDEVSIDLAPFFE